MCDIDCISFMSYDLENDWKVTGELEDNMVTISFFRFGKLCNYKDIPAVTKYIHLKGEYLFYKLENRYEDGFIHKVYPDSKLPIVVYTTKNSKYLRNHKKTVVVVDKDGNQTYSSYPESRINYPAFAALKEFRKIHQDRVNFKTKLKIFGLGLLSFAAIMFYFH